MATTELAKAKYRINKEAMKYAKISKEQKIEWIIDEIKTNIKPFCKYYYISLNNVGGTTIFDSRLNSEKDLYDILSTYPVLSYSSAQGDGEYYNVVVCQY